jgi:hypothetical protein
MAVGKVVENHEDNGESEHRGDPPKKDLVDRQNWLRDEGNGYDPVDYVETRRPNSNRLEIV